MRHYAITLALGGLVLGCGEGAKNGAAKRPARKAPPPARKAVARPAPAMARVAATPARPTAPPPAANGSFAVDLGARPLGVKTRTHRAWAWQRITFRGSAGDTVHGLFRRAKGKRRRPAILLGHGHGGDKRGMAEYIGEAFHDKNVTVLAVDHPYHGARKKRGRDICPFRPRPLVARWTRAVRDLRRAVAVLQAMSGVDPKRIGYAGFSLGGVLGALMISHEPAVKAAVLLAPGGNWKVLSETTSSWKIGWSRKHLPRWLRNPETRKLLALVDPANFIRRFAPRPLLVVAGREDRVIRIEAAEALYRSAGKGRQIWRHPAGHSVPGRVRARMAAWLVKKLEE